MIRSYLFLATLLFGAIVASAQPAPDPIGEAFFAPELVMQHQQTIGLTDGQRENIKREMRQAQLQFTELQWKLQDEVEQMAKLIAQPRVEEDRVLAQLAEVLNAEREVKRTQITLLVRIKNQLSAEQQAQLRKLRSATP